MRTPRFLAVALAGALATFASTAAPAGDTPGTHWQATWMASPQPVWDDSFVLPLGMPRVLENVTLRQHLRTSLDGERLRLVISNEYGQHALKLGHAAVALERYGAPHRLLFDGAQEVLVAPGARVVSDPVALPTQAGDRLQVDLYLREPTRLAGFHWDARDRTFLLAGDGTAGASSAGQAPLSARAFVSSLLVESSRAPRAVIAIGDSITDGNGATPGDDQRWTDHLARRLAPHGVAVLNAGISGNRLLRDGMGESALARFDRDVLQVPGVQAVILLLGTNDIGWPGGPFAPHEPAATVPSLTRGLQQLAARAHAQGVRVIGATVPPFEDALKGTPLEGHYSPAKEQVRQQFNAWIRRTDAFDAVVDFDSILRDPARPRRLRADFDSGDHLHPGDAGYRAMADAVDLDALLGARKPEVQQ